MTTMMSDWLTRDRRKWIYGICLAIVPLLVLYGVIDESSAPLWIALAGAIIAPSLALANLAPDKEPTDE
jgi:hypothetical protein